MHSPSAAEGGVGGCCLIPSCRSLDLRQIRLKHLHFALQTLLGCIPIISFPPPVLDVCHFHSFAGMPSKAASPLCSWTTMPRDVLKPKKTYRGHSLQMNGSFTLGIRVVCCCCRLQQYRLKNIFLFELFVLFIFFLSNCWQRIFNSLKRDKTKLYFRTQLSFIA